MVPMMALDSSSSLISRLRRKSTVPGEWGGTGAIRGSVGELGVAEMEGGVGCLVALISRLRRKSTVPGGGAGKQERHDG